MCVRVENEADCDYDKIEVVNLKEYWEPEALYLEIECEDYCSASGKDECSIVYDCRTIPDAEECD